MKPPNNYCKAIRKKQGDPTDKPHYENVPFEVPEGWCWASLNSACTIFGRIGFRGYTKDDLVDSTGAITLSPSNIVDGVMNYEKCTYISWEKYEESPEIQVQNEDILLVKTGSSYGKCAYVESLPKEATINPQFVVLRFIGCNPRFLTYCLQSNYARKQYEEFVLGTAIPTFTQVALGAMAIPMPPIEEQERIVAEVEKLLSFVDSLDENTNELGNAITVAKSKILDLAIHGKLVPQDASDEPASELLKRINPKAIASCDNPHYEQVGLDTPSNWLITSLSDICDNINGLWTGKKPPFVRVGVIRNANFTKDFRLDYSKIEYIEVEEKSFEKRHLLNGDIIVEKSGGSDKNPVGRAILYEGVDKQFSYSNFTMVLRIRNHSCVYSKYLYYYLMAVYLRGDMRKFQTQTTGLHNLILDSYLSMPIYLPPFEEQKRISNKIDELFKSLEAIANTLR